MAAKNIIYNIYEKNIKTGNLKFIGGCIGKSLEDAFESFKTNKTTFINSISLYNKRKYYVLINKESIILGSMWGEKL